MTAQNTGKQAALNFIASGPKLLLIDGKWVPAVSGKTFATINPATEEVLTTVAEGPLHRTSANLFTSTGR